MDSTRIAIDIALLPPDSVMDAAIGINQQLLAQQPSQLQLSKTSRLPHITLMQAVVSADDLPELESRLHRIATQTGLLQLTAHFATNPDFSSYQITNTLELQALHEQIMNECADLVTYDSLPEYYDDAEVSQLTLDWLRGFREHAAFANFGPHITLGEGELNEDVPDQSFTATRLAICHLGNFNTCKRVLFELGLNKHASNHGEHAAN